MNAYGIYGPMSGPARPRSRPAVLRGRAGPALRRLAGRPRAGAAGRRAGGARLRPRDARLRLRALSARRRRRSAFSTGSRPSAAASATWGMRFAGIEFRRGDGTRFDATDDAAAYRDLRALLSRCPFLQLLSCLTILFTRYRQGVPDLVARDHGDHPAGRLSRRPAFTACGESCCRAPQDLLLRLGPEGGSDPGHMRHSLPQSHQFYVTAPQPCPVPARKGRAEAVHRAAGRGCLPPERRAVAPGLPALAERALPAVLRRLLGLPVGADRGRASSRRRAASGG